MNLKQLQLICEMVNSDFNVSRTADSLFTTQPAISTQIKNLEEELSLKMFIRKGKRITNLTPAGEEIYHYAQEALVNVRAIKSIAQEYTSKDKGTLRIATTHTQARYALPEVIKAFCQKYPNVQLRIHQGDPAHISEMVIHGEADFAIATESISEYDKLAMLPVYQWNRCIVTPKNHPLLKKQKITLQDIVEYPIVTYDFAFAGRSVINKAFTEHNLKPNIVLTATDSDVIKTYVELGLGIGLLANMAFDDKKDLNLKKIDVSHLFENSTTYVGFKKRQYLRHYMYDFLSLFSPNLSRDSVDKANDVVT